MSPLPVKELFQNCERTSNTFLVRFMEEVALLMEFIVVNEW